MIILQTQITQFLTDLLCIDVSYISFNLISMSDLDNFVGFPRFGDKPFSTNASIGFVGTNGTMV